MYDRYRTSIALIAGVAAGWLFNWFVVSEFAASSASQTAVGTAEPWFSRFFSHALALSWLTPGFVTGLIAARRGILLGALAAAISALLSIVPEITFFMENLSPLRSVFKTLLSVFERYGASIICSAVAGGCAQYLRSNNALQRTRGG